MIAVTEIFNIGLQLYQGDLLIHATKAALLRSNTHRGRFLGLINVGSGLTEDVLQAFPPVQAKVAKQIQPNSQMVETFDRIVEFKKRR